MRRTADANGVLWQKGCFCVVFHGAHGGESTHTLLASAHRHTDRDTRLHVVFWHTFVQLTTGRTADMSQQRQTPTHTECDTDLHHNAHTHTQDGGRGTSTQCTTGRTAGKIYIRHSHTTLHPPYTVNTIHRHTTHTRTRTSKTQERRDDGKKWKY